MIFGLPVSVLGLYYACPDTHCSVTAWPPAMPTDWSDFWSPTALAVVLGWCAGNFLFLSFLKMAAPF